MSAAVIASTLLFSHAATAQLFTPDATFLHGINVDETAAFGATGTLNSITHNGNAVDFDVTFGPSGDESVAVDAQFFGPLLDLSGYTGTSLHTKVISGSSIIQLFIQDGTPAFSYSQNNGPTPQTSADGTLSLVLNFSDTPVNGPGPFDPSQMIRYGFKFYGDSGTRAVIEIGDAAVPDASSSALLLAGITGALEYLRRRKTL